LHRKFWWWCHGKFSKIFTSSRLSIRLYRSLCIPIKKAIRFTLEGFWLGWANSGSMEFTSISYSINLAFFRDCPSRFSTFDCSIIFLLALNKKQKTKKKLILQITIFSPAKIKSCRTVNIKVDRRRFWERRIYT
jgi:hypothetical protein